ncbi:uncharacterized protein LOC124435030 isoform X2 [Xenia sp. Carnegie-2017]|uniref:uncharacterized protein LOC124435030 isoform X2 n=1 Tax=Xenia sp. Carnegie-2017 TaxID=2897299 RepID=UPI001F03F691|nr:uncharacterized protein LOC124435030 isoform X2 [Xenia sp. Carnegie-2017]
MWKEYQETSNEQNSTPVKANNSSLFQMPQSDVEMRFCLHCNFQADDWPTFSKHVFKQSHLKNIAKAYNIHLSAEPVSNTFFCDVCVAQCTNQKNWVSHLLGTRHRKTLEMIGESKAEEKIGHDTGMSHKQKPYSRPQKNQTKHVVRPLSADEFNNYPEPLIGLEFLTEIQEAGQVVRFECSICKLKFASNTIFAHLVGQKHRTNVLKLKRPGSVKGVANLKRSEITLLLLRESTKLENEEGRQQIGVKVLSSNINIQKSQQNFPLGRGSPGARGNTQYRDRGRAVNQVRNESLGVNLEKAYPRGDVYTASTESLTREEFTTCNILQPYHNTSHTYSQPSHEPYNHHYSETYVKDWHSDYSNSMVDPHNSYVHSQKHLPRAQSYLQVSHAHYREAPVQKPDNTKKGGISSHLVSALGDLTKLVQNEEDASVALHISNALTQALLTYRMGGELKGDV